MARYDAKDILQHNIGFALGGGLAASVVEGQLPELRGDFPNFHNFDCKQHLAGNILLVMFDCKASGIPAVGDIADDVANDIYSIVESVRAYRELREIASLQKYFSKNKFLFVVDLIDGGFDWEIAVLFVIDWMNDVAVPYAFKLNERRILRAIPSPPQYSQRDVFESLWVLESDQSMSQGTAFSLNRVGVVTCEHVVSGANELRAFHPSAPQKKFEVSVVKKHEVLDLALVRLSGANTEKGASKNSSFHEPVRVCWLTA